MQGDGILKKCLAFICSNLQNLRTPVIYLGPPPPPTNPPSAHRSADPRRAHSKTSLQCLILSRRNLRTVSALGEQSVINVLFIILLFSLTGGIYKHMEHCRSKYMYLKSQ